MYDLRLQLGFNFDTLLSAVAAEQTASDPEALSHCVAMALNALEGADYLAVTLTPSEFVQQVVGLLATLAHHRLLIRVCVNDAECVAKAYAHKPAQVCLVPSQHTSYDNRLVSAGALSLPTSDVTETLVALPSSDMQGLDVLPETIEGVCVDAREWASCRGTEREQKLSTLGSIIEHVNDTERFVYLTDLPSLKDAEEAAALPGVSAIEVGAGLLSHALHKGLGNSLQALLKTLVQAQEAGLQLALEDHEHHHHDHDEDCGCHH